MSEYLSIPSAQATLDFELTSSKASKYDTSHSMKPLSPLARELVKLSSPGICPACEIRTSLRILRQLNKPWRSTTKRYASTVSVTAVNAQRDVPPKFQKLHRALNELKENALSYVNISKLQLALRGLESTSPVTRIAGELDRLLCWLVLPNLRCSAWCQQSEISKDTSAPSHRRRAQR